MQEQDNQKLVTGDDSQVLEILKQMNRDLKDQEISLEKLTNVILQIRKLCSKEVNPKLAQIVEAAIMPTIIKIANTNFSISNSTRIDILWIITNISSGDSNQTQYVMSEGGCDFLLENLGNVDNEINDQALWGIGNIAGDSAAFRDQLINNHKCVELVVQYVENWNENTSIKSKENAVWVMSNLCRGKPKVDYQKIKTMVPYFFNFLNINYGTCVHDSLWALSYISDSDSDETLIDLITNYDIVQKVIPFLDDASKLLIPALRSLGNIATGSDMCVDSLISNNAIPKVISLLKHEKKTVRKEACWFLSNVGAGSPQQVVALVNTDNFFESIETVLSEDQNEVKKEAMWTISNILSVDTQEPNNKLLNNNALQMLNNGMNSLINEATIIKVYLEGCELYLKNFEVLESAIVIEHKGEIENCLLDVIPQIIKKYQDNYSIKNLVISILDGIEDWLINDNDDYEIKKLTTYAYVLAQQIDSSSNNGENDDTKWEKEHIQQQAQIELALDDEEEEELQKIDDNDNNNIENSNNPEEANDIANKVSGLTMDEQFMLAAAGGSCQSAAPE